MDWINNEFKYIDLGDKRLNNRIKSIANDRIENTEKSLPQSFNDSSKLKAAYRFFSNDYVNPEKIMASHYIMTKERARQENVVIAAQDTTSISPSTKNSAEGMGSIRCSKQRGFFLHSTLLFTEQASPLGIIDEQIWSRNDSEIQKSKDRKKKPNYKKESYKWFKSLEKTSKLQSELPKTKIVNVSDRESDIYEYFLEAEDLKQTILVRSTHNRKLENSDYKLQDFIKQYNKYGNITKELYDQKIKKNRYVEFTVKYSLVDLKPAKNMYSKYLDNTKLNVVHIEEVNPPEGNEPINWFLLTNEPVDSFEKALQIVNWYQVRWQIEIFHKILKSGCNVEKRQFKDIKQINNYLALDSIVAFRVHFITMQSRIIPDESCELLFSKDEWKPLFCYARKTAKLPDSPPTVKEIKLLIAKLGGFLGRKSDGEPGVTIMWRGLQSYHKILEAWNSFSEAFNVDFVK